MRICSIILILSSLAAGQSVEAALSAGTPSRMLLLVHQEIKSGKAAERRKLEVASAEAYDRLNVSVHWILLDGLTGPGNALFLDPFDSYAGLERASKVLAQLYAAHPELTRLQQSIDETLAGSKTVFAIRRDDLSPQADQMDESKARYVRVQVIHVYPGHEDDFGEAARSAAGPRVVYQVMEGTSEPTFIILQFMHALSEQDEMASQEQARNADDSYRERLQKVEREAYSSAESNLYAISPEMSHVTREFAAGDLDFWTKRPKNSTPAPSTLKEKKKIISAPPN